MPGVWNARGAEGVLGPREERAGVLLGLEGQVGRGEARVQQRTPHGSRGGHEQAALRAREGRDEHGGAGLVEDVEPRFEQGVPGEGFDEDVDAAAAADPEAPHDVLAEVVAGEARRAFPQRVEGRLDDLGFQTAAGEHAGLHAVVTDEHGGALTAVGAAVDARDGREGHALTARVRVSGGGDELTGLGSFHDDLQE